MNNPMVTNNIKVFLKIYQRIGIVILKSIEDKKIYIKKTEKSQNYTALYA